MEDEKLSMGEIILALGILLGIVVFVCMVGALVLHAVPGETTTETHEIYYCKAPIGIYYTDVEGSGGILYTHIDSSLGEGYVIKYLVNGELFTLLPDSTSKYTHVYLTNETEMSITIKEHHSIIGTLRHTEYFIYIPDPSIL